ncbi:hypothetical protein [Kriegella aquimaris]|uniref:DUF4179 domain-containing protein n=1 Tax=Kriegella aquimaris TaxID=192904 RepID=A0A1G9W874_9FLAO|nr:hypothetical protein [Kriegella aquimaris]SDM80712.1 hypothetical protein SAMN04488514_1153 [Kriegella aquimaris]
MIEKEKLENLFAEIRESLDYHEPDSGHKERFFEKLNAKNTSISDVRGRRIRWIKSLSIAASLALIIALGAYIGNAEPTMEEQVARISPEASNTQFYFANLIEEQVKKLKEEVSPETLKIIDDTLLQLKNLEKDYKELERNLIQGGNSKLILSAMITNFQTRINLLNAVLNQIETIKILKNNSNENTI